MSDDNHSITVDTISGFSIKQPVLYNDFRSQVKGGWNNVHPDIRDRMNQLLTSPTPTVFEGDGCVRCSKIGYIFAHITKLFGSPLVWHQGENVKTTVTVAPTKNGLRCWHRLFKFEDGTEQMVQTTKVVDPKFGFLDVVGTEGEKRLTTQMNVWAGNKSLYFESTAYWLRFKYFRLRVPALFTPGKLFAEHRDEGNGYFRYTIKFNHFLWGETFYQDGIFRMID